MIPMYEIYLEYFRCIINFSPTEISGEVWKHIALHAEHSLDKTHQIVPASLHVFLLHWFDDSVEDTLESLTWIMSLKGSGHLAGSCLLCMKFTEQVQGALCRFWYTLLVQDILTLPDRRKLLLTCQTQYITFVKGPLQGHCSLI